MVNMPTSKRKTTSKQEPKEPVRTFHNKKDLINQIVTKKPKSKFLSESQKHYYNELTQNEITICSGPAGVGKSMLQ
mgnify:FL=1